jgi:hypothetical protein
MPNEFIPLRDDYAGTICRPRDYVRVRQCLQDAPAPHIEYLECAGTIVFGKVPPQQDGVLFRVPLHRRIDIIFAFLIRSSRVTSHE